MKRENCQYFTERRHFHYFFFSLYCGSMRALFALVSRKTVLLSVLLKSDLCSTSPFPQKDMLLRKINLCLFLFQVNLRNGFNSSDASCKKKKNWECLCTVNTSLAIPCALFCGANDVIQMHEH